MKKLATLIIITSIYLTGCVTTSSTKLTENKPSSSTIKIDGDFSDWKSLNIKPLLIDPVGDTDNSFQQGDIKALYYKREGSLLNFYVAYVNNVSDDDIYPRIWIDVNQDNKLNENDYQIEAIKGEVLVQTLEEPFKGYLKIDSSVATSQNSVEFSVNADQLGIVDDDFTISGAILKQKPNSIAYIDHFEEKSIEKEQTANSNEADQIIHKEKLPVPERFRKQDRDVKIGITLTNFDDSLWFYPETTIDDLINLFGKEPHMRWELDDGILYSFKLDGGGSLMFYIKGKGLSMIYSRNTTKVGLADYPPLPWSVDLCYSLFGEDKKPKRFDDENVFIYVNDIPGLNGLRLDIVNESVTGIRVLMPEDK